MDRKTKIQVISCGPGLSEIRDKHGHSSEWISAMISDETPNISIVEVYNGNFPTIEDNTAWIIMGSRYSAYDKLDWISKLESLIAKGAKSKVPMLGICFGHQILCKALGGKVVNNVNGWEIGSSSVELTKKGSKSALFEDFSSPFSVYESHHDAVVDLPSTLDVLAENKYGIQAVSFSDFVYGVQFHPEFSFDVMKAYYNARVKSIDDNDFHVAPHNDGAMVVGNFIRSIYNG